MKKKILWGLVLVIIIGVGVGYFIWNKPHRNVEKEDGIQISSIELVKAYDANETVANSKFLDKAITVSGPISAVELNQDSLPTITLKSANEMRSVYCTLKNKTPLPATGSTVTIKGICTGVLSDVTIIDAIINEP